MKDITLEQIAAVVREAAGLMVHSGFEVHDKGSRENLVTSSDIAVQHFLTERLGFRQSSDPFLLDGIPHIRMSWYPEPLNAPEGNL